MERSGMSPKGRGAGRRSKAGKRRINPSPKRWSGLEILEPRLLLNGETIPPLYDLPGMHDATLSVDSLTHDDPSARLLIVDSDADAESLLAAISPGTSIHRLDNTAAGIPQITQILSNCRNVTEIFILSHGTEGAIDLGGSTVGTAQLLEASSDVSLWQGHLADGATIVLFGCNVAAGAAGEQFVNTLAALTGAGVAASTNRTGLGGDWVFEYQTNNAAIVIPFEGYALDLFAQTRALFAPDAYEANDSLETATNFGQVTGTLNINNLTIHNASDHDWFRFQTTATGTGSNYVDLFFSHATGDVDMRLCDSGGGTIASATSVTDNEHISLNGLAAGTYYVEVYGYSGATNLYSMEISAPEVLPELTVSVGTTTHKVGLGATVVDSGLTISSHPAGAITSATVSIISGLKTTEDLLGLPEIEGISTDYTAATGVLAITSSSARNYGEWETILRQVTYGNTQSPFATLNNRSVRFTLNGVNSGGKTVAVDLPLDSAIRGRIEEAFGVVETVGGEILGIVGLPLYSDQTEVPFTGGRTVTDLFYPHLDELDAGGNPIEDFGRSIQPQQIGSFLEISAAVSDYFAGAGDSATIAGLNAAIAARLASIVAGATPLITVDGQFSRPADTDDRAIEITVTISTSKGDQQTLDIGETARDLNLRLPDGPTVSVGGGADIALSVSVDLEGHTYGGALAQNKVTLAFETLDAIAGFSFSGLNTTAEIGAIRGGITGGSGTVAARFPVAFSGATGRTLDNWGSGGVTGFGACVGTADISFPISASIGGVFATTGDTRLVIHDDNIFDSAAATYTATDFGKLQFFATISVENIIQEILNAGGLYRTLENSGESLFGLRVPFVTDTTLGDLFDFGLVFDDAIGSQVDVVEAVLNTPGRDELLDPRLPLSADAQPKPAMWSDLRAAFQFGIVLNNQWPVHAVAVAADNSRQTLGDLVADLNTALGAAGLDIQASNVQNKIVFKATDVSIRRFAIVPVAPDAGRLSPASPPADLSTLTPGTAYYFQVTGTTAGTVKGTNYYTLDSAVAAAAVHAGVLANGQTGVVKVTRVGVLDAWSSTRNGIASSAASGQQMFLIESGDADIQRLGIVPEGTALSVLESLTQGTLRASLPFAADLSGDAAFTITVGGSTYAVTVTDNNRADRLLTLIDVWAGLLAAGIPSTLLDARLVDAQGNVAASLDPGADYYLQFFLPSGSAASTFSIAPVTDAGAHQVLPLGFLVGEASAAPRPEALRTFEDFQNGALFPGITITPVYDNVANTVTLQFKATRTLADLEKAAGIGFNILPLGRFTPAEGETVEFAPTVQIAFGLEFLIAPTSPVTMTAGADAPANGRLTGSASFTVDLVLDDRFDVTVPKAWTDANADIQDLVGDVNRALRQALDSNNVSTDLTADRLVARRYLDNNRLEIITAVPTNSGAAISITHTGGVLGSDLVAPFTHDGAHYILSVSAASTAANTGWADLILDINNALSSVIIDANSNGVIDSGEIEVSLSALLFATTISDASGARVNETAFFATEPAGAAWPAVMNLLADGTAVTELGFSDGSGGSSARLTSSAAASSPFLRNHSDGTAFASGAIEMSLPSYEGSVRYGFNTLNFAAVENGFIDLKAAVRLADGVDVTTRDVGSELDACFQRALSGSDGTGNAAAGMTLADITASSGADIDANAKIRFTVPDMGDTTVIVEVAIGLPIPVPQAAQNGTLSGNATINFLYLGAKYSVTVTAAAAAGNTTFAQLAAQFDAALAVSTKTVLGVAEPGFDASGLFSIVENDGQIEVRAKIATDNPDYASVEFLPGLSAFGEVGLQGAFGLDVVVQSLIDSLIVFDTLQNGLTQFSAFALPLINTPLGDLIDVKGDLLGRFTKLSGMTVASPADLAPALAAALSVPAQYVGVAFDAASNAYRIDFQFETGLITSKPLDITLSDFYRFTGQTLPGGLSRLVDTGGASPLTVKIEAVSVFSVGIDLTDPNNPKTFLYGHDGSGDMRLSDGTANGTSIEVLTTIVGEDINFTAALGAFGVFVREGNARLGGPAVMAGDDVVYDYDEENHQLHPLTSADAASLAVALANGKYYLSPSGGESDALNLENYAAAFDGTVDINLPLFTPTEFINPFTNRTVEVFLLGEGPTTVHPGGNLVDIKINDLQSFYEAYTTLNEARSEIGRIYTTAAGEDRGLTQGESDRVDELELAISDLRSSGVVEIYTPDVADATSGIRPPTLFDLLRDPALLLDGLDIFLGAIETGLRALDNLNLPVIGPALGSAAQGVFAWRGGWLRDMKYQMRGQGEAVLEVARDAMFDFLGPSGINLLLKDNGIRSVDGMIQADSPDDITLAFVDENGVPLTGMGGYGAYGVEFKVRLGSVLLDTGVNLGFDFDALEPVFSLALNGGLDFKLGWDLSIGFGINLDDGFYVIVDSDPTANELELRFEAYLRGPQADYGVIADAGSPTGFTIVDGDGNPVYGPRKGDGSRDILRAMAVLAGGVNAPEGTGPDTIDGCDACSGRTPGGPLIEEAKIYWVVAAETDDHQWVPAYIDMLGYFRPQQGENWEDFNGTDSRNPDQMILFNRTGPLSLHGELFFLQLNAQDMIQRGLEPKGDADYFYDPAQASTITANGRNNPDYGVNRNNDLPTRVAGRIGVNVADPSSSSGNNVARPGPTITGFMLMDGSDILGGRPVLDANGDFIPVQYTDGQWYVMELAEGGNPLNIGGYEQGRLITKDPSENRITFAEMREAGASMFEFKLNAEAVVNLSLTLYVSDNANIPRITATFNLDWRTDSMTPPANPFAATTEQKRDLVPEVGLNDIRLDLGSFLTKFIKPIAEKIDSALEPIDPLIDVLETPIPVISAIAGRDIKLTTLLVNFGGPKGKAIGTLIEMMILVRQLSAVMAAVPDGVNVYLPIGNFWLAKVSAGPFGQPGLGTQIYYDNSEVSAPSITQRNQSMIAESGSALNSVTNALGALDQMDRESSQQEGITDRSRRGGFTLPIIQDPITIFKLLMGEDVPLVTFSLPTVDFSLSVSIPLVRILIFEVGLRFDFQVRGQLQMGYDTYGIRIFHESRDPADLLQGFYISDRRNADGTGDDVDEFYARATIALYGGVDVALARAGIEGGFTFTGAINLNDPNNDGKLRVQEMIDLVSYTGNPLDLADLRFSGEVYARYYYWVGLRIWTPWKTYTVTLYSGGRTFARMTLFSFTREGNDGPPTFASLADTVDENGTRYDDTLVIHAGPSASKRVSNQDPLKAADGAERFEVWNDSPGSGTVHVRYLNFSATQTQTFNNVSRVVFIGGAGNDTINASGLRGLPVFFEGGEGDDTLIIGSGDADEESILRGGPGNDTITVSATGICTLDGGDGNDVITAGTGTSTIIGGFGNDTITGGGSGSVNKIMLERQFGIDVLVLNAAAQANLLDFTQASSAIVANLESDESYVTAGGSNRVTFDLAKVTEIRGTTARDTFNITNPATRNANSGRGLVIRGGQGADVYNIVADDLSNMASDGITIDDGIYPDSQASVGGIGILSCCGGIKSIAVAVAGLGYVTPPEVVITDPTGAGARAVAGIDDQGRVTGIYVISRGRGYTSPVIELVTPVSTGDRLIYTAQTDAGVALDHAGNGGQDYRITSGGKSIKWVGWNQPHTPRPITYGISEMDNIDFNLPNAALTVDADIDLLETLSITGKRLVQNAAITADTIKIATQRGLQISHPLNATNNGDISLRVTGRGLADYANALAQAAAQVVGGELTGVTVNEGGAYYDFAPIVSVLGANGAGARAQAVIDGSGQVVAVNVTADGEGYFTTPAPTIRIAPPAGIQINAPLTSSTVGSLPGTGDGRGTFSLRADLGAIDMGGYIEFPAASFVEWEDGGFAYRSSSDLDDITPDLYPQTVGGSGAEAEAVLDGDGRITAINIISGGSGYSSLFLPSVEIQGIAEATAIVENGSITGFHITNPGYGYAIAPQVTIRSNGFGKIVGADEDQTDLNRTHLKSANGYLVAVAYYGIGQPDQPVRTDVRNMVAQTFGDGAGVYILEKDALAIGLIDQINGISTVDGDASITLFGGTLSLGTPVQQTNSSGQLLWQDANKTIPIYVVDGNGNIIYEGGRLMVGAARVQITADDVDVNNMISATGGILELQPVRFDSAIGLTGTRATVEAVIENGQVTGFTNLWGGRGYDEEPLVIMPPPGERAFGVTSILNGQVTGINLVYGGTRYSAEHPPTVTIVGGGLSGVTPADQATATAQYDANGSVTGFTITNAGSGYYTPPVVVISLPGHQATARAVVENGVVVGLDILNPGSNYASAPAVTIAQPYVFDLDGDEIAFFQKGFKEVIIGRADGSHTFYSPLAEFQDNLRLRAPRFDGNFQMESVVVESGGGIIIVGSGHTYYLTTASPVTSGSFIEIDDSVRVNDGVNGQITATGTYVNIFGAGKGKIDGQAGSTTENLAITAGTTITVTGAIGSQDPLTNLTLNSTGGGTINLQQGVTLDGDLHIVKSGDLVLGGNLIIGGDLVIDAAASISFSGSVLVLGDLIIENAGTVNFAQNVQIGGDFIVGSLATPADVTSLTFSATSRLDVDGNVRIYTASQISFGAAVGQSSPPASMTLLSNSGDITFQGVTVADVITVIKARDVTFVQELTADLLTITDATGQTRFQRLTRLGTADITSTNFVQVQNGFQISVGNVTITSNEIDFAGGTGSVIYTGSGDSTLTLKPRATGRAITIGSPPGSFTSLDLSDVDLAAIAAGFDQVVIGDSSDGTGAVTIGSIGSSQGAGNSQILNDTSIYGGSINVAQNVDAVDGVSLLQLVARTGNILVNGAINSTTADRSAAVRLQTLDPIGQVTINQPVHATDLISIISPYAVSAGASGTVNAPNLRVSAGGDVTLGNNNAVTTLAIAAGNNNITFRDDTGFAIGTVDGVSGINSGSADTTLTSSGPVTQSAAVTADGLLLKGAGGVYTLTNAANDVNTIAAATGSVNFRDADDLQVSGFGGVAGITTTGGVTLEAISGDLTLLATDDVNSVEAVILTASGRIYTAADVTTVNNGVTFNAPVTLTGDVAVSTGAGAGNIVFQTVDGGFGLALAAGTGSVTFGLVGGGTPLSGLTVASANAVTFGGSATTTGAQDITATTVETRGTHTTSGNNIRIAGQMSMQDNTTLTTGTGAGDIEIYAIAGNGRDLVVLSGSGAATIQGAASALGRVTLQADHANATGAVAFRGNLAANEIITFGRGYSVALTGSVTQITGALAFLNTGTVTLGDQNSDVLTFAAGLGTADSATNPALTRIAGTIRTAGQIVRLGPAELDADSAIDTTNNGGSAASQVFLRGAVNGADAAVDGLAVTGNAQLDAAIGSVRTLEYLTVSGTSALNGGAVTTSGIQTYTGAATLGADTTLAGSFITFGATLGSADYLVITGNARFDGAVTLEYLTVSGTSAINGGAVTTSGIQTYTGAATLGADTMLTGSSITFGNTLGSADYLVITGNARFDGAVTLEYLTVSGTSAINGGSVTTSGIQTYTGAATLGSDTTLAGSSITFGNTLGSTDYLVITGNARFDGAVTLEYLTVSGTSAINGGSVTTSGIQTYTGAATLGADTTLTGSSITFGTALSGTTVSGGHKLTVQAAGGNVTVNAVVDTDDDLNIEAETIDLNGDISALAVVLTGDVRILKDITIEAPGGLTINGTLSGNYALTVHTADMNLRVTGETSLGALTIQKAAEIEFGDVTAGSLTITEADDITAGQVDVAGALTIQKAAQIEFGDVTAASLTITEADDVTAGQVDVTGDIIIGSANNLTLGAVTAASLAQSAGTGTTRLTGAVALNGAVSIAAAAIEIEDDVTAGPVEFTASGAIHVAAGVVITSDGDVIIDGAIEVILANGVRIIVSGDAIVDLLSDGDVTVNGRIESAAGNISLRADRDGDGAGSLVVASAATSSINSAAGDIILSGGDVSIGSAGFAAAVTASNGGIVITGGPACAITVANEDTVFFAAADVTIGDPAGGEGTPGQVDLTGWITAGGAISVRSLGDVNTDNLRAMATADIDVYADNDIIVRNSLIVSLTGRITLMPDADGDLNGTLVLLNARLIEGVALPDLKAAVAPYKMPAAVLAGAAGKARVTITNEGQRRASGKVDVLLFLSGSDTIGDDAVLLAVKNNVEVRLKAGKSVAQNINFTLASDLPDGDYYLIAQIVPNRNIMDLNASNNTGAALTVLQVRKPDLVPSSITSNLGASVLTGAAGVAVVQVTNAGLVPARKSVQVRVYATTTGTMDGAVEVGRTTVALSLNPGVAGNVNVSLAMPVVAGDYRLLTVVDAANDLTEADETNNTLLGGEAITVANRFIDLEAAYNGNTLAVANLAGANGVAGVVIRNLGNIRAAGTVNVRVFASTDGELDGGDVEVGSTTVAVALNPGVAQNVAVRVNIPNGMPVGEYRLIGEISPVAPLTDANNLNNVAVLDQAVTVTMPDLLPTTIGSTFRSVALPDERGTVSVTFVNDGQVLAGGSVNVAVYATTTGGMDGAVEIGRVNNVPVNLAPGASKSQSLAVRLPSTIGVYNLLAVIDDGNAVAETNEANNTILSAGTVSVRAPFVDLITLAPELRVFGPLKPGDAARVTVRFRNEGNIRAKGFVKITLYASSDQTLSASDTELKAVSGRKVTLRPGRSKKFDIGFNLPADIAAGDYYLIALVEPDSRLSYLELVDTNLANNVAATAAAFTVAE